MVIKNPPKISPGLIFEGGGLIIGMIFVLRIRGGGGLIFGGGGLLSGFYGILLLCLLVDARSFTEHSRRNFQLLG